MSLEDIERILAAINLGAYEDIRPQLEVTLRQYAVDRAEAAARSVARAAEVTEDQLNRMLSQANLDAVAWAERHAAELITEITDTTASEIREMVTLAVEEGASVDELAAALEDAYAFSPERSNLIATTETSFADNRGTIDGWKASNLVAGKEWLPDVDPCPICEANAAQGPIGIDATFLSGDPAPPAHPRCECTVLAVLVDE